MKQLLVLFFMSVIGDLATATEDWLCTTESSQMQGESVKTCGKAFGYDEDDARKWAFHEAHMEFWRLCQASSNCKGYDVSIVPGRTTCEEKKTKPSAFKDYKRWTCYRMLTFIIDRSKPACDENGAERYKGCPMNQAPYDGLY